MRKIFKFSISLVVLVCHLLPALADPLSSSSVQASFDCAKAKSLIEKKICSNDQLKTLDSKVALAYKKLQGTITPSELPLIKSEAKDWLSLRDKTCASSEDSQCLVDIYQSRLNSLEQFTAKLKETTPRNVSNPEGSGKSLSEEAQAIIFPPGESTSHVCDSPAASVRRVGGVLLIAYFECDSELTDGRDADEIQFAVLEGEVGHLKVKAQGSDAIEKTVEQGIFDSVMIDDHSYTIGTHHAAFIVRVGSEYNSTSSHEIGTQLLLIENLGSELRTVLKLPVSEDSAQKVALDSSKASQGYFNLSVSSGKKTKTYHWKKEKYSL